MTSNEQKLKKLLDWLLTDNTKSHIVENIEVREAKGSGRGLYAKDTINAHTPIIKIDHSHLLNFTTIVAHILSWNNKLSPLPEIYRHIKVPSNGKHDSVTEIYQNLELDELTRLSSFQILSMYLVLEKSRGPNSWWEPFIDMLPPMEDFIRSPFVWKVQGKEKVFNKLPSSVRRRANDMFEKFTNDYEVVSNLLSSHGAENSLLKKDEFLLYWMCINSRCLYMEMPQKKTIADNFTMAPYVDFINHSSNDQCVLKIDRTGFNVLTSNKYEKDDELYLSYGAHSNDFILCEYGFYLNQNPWNDIDVSTDILSLMNPAQIEYLKEHDYYGGYTLTENMYSFRTEVALSIAQEENPVNNRRLNAHMQGITDGSYYQKGSYKIIGKIMLKLEAKYEKYLQYEYKDDPDLKVMGKLYRDRMDIIESILQLVA